MEFRYLDGHLYKVRADKSLSLLRARSKCNGKYYYSFRLGGRAGKTLYVHRKIWELHNGTIPKGMVIDHINGDTLDNRIENLQCITQNQNLQKQKCRSDSVTGHKNISIKHSLGSSRYVVRVQREKRTYNLGAYILLEDALAARNKFNETPV